MKNILIITMLLFPLISLSQTFNIGKQVDGSFETMTDYKLYECVNDSVSILADCGCYERFAKIWNIVIDENYENIIKNLSGDRKDNFIKSQKLWVNYKDAEIKAAYDSYRAIENGGGIYDYHQRLVKIYRTRALELQEYIKKLRI